MAKRLSADLEFSPFQPLFHWTRQGVCPMVAERRIGRSVHEMPIHQGNESIPIDVGRAERGDCRGRRVFPRSSLSRRTSNQQPELRSQQKARRQCGNRIRKRIRGGRRSHGESIGCAARPGREVTKSDITVNRLCPFPPVRTTSPKRSHACAAMPFVSLTIPSESEQGRPRHRNIAAPAKVCVRHVDCRGRRGATEGTAQPIWAERAEASSWGCLTGA